MANQIIRPDDLPPRANPVASEVVPSDNGSVVAGVTWADGVNAGRPLASQNEAEAGVNATKAMTPLTTKQAIEAQAITGLTAGENVTISGPANNPVIDATAELSSGSRGDVSVITPTTEWRINRRFDTVAALLADDGSGPTGMGYAGSGAPVIVAAGDNVTAGGIRYEVAAADALDSHIENDGGVKLYLRETTVRPEMLGAVGDGVTDDFAPLKLAITLAETLVLSRHYAINQYIQVDGKTDIRIVGEAGAKITYTGTGPDWCVMWLTGYKNFDLQGSLEIDCDGKVNSGLVVFGVTGAVINIEGVTVRNMVGATGFGGAHGIRVAISGSGAGDIASIRNCRAYNLTRTDDAIPAQAFLVSGYLVQEFVNLIVDGVRRNTGGIDCDAIVAFQPQTSGLYALGSITIRNCLLKNTSGRFFKVQSRGWAEASGLTCINDDPTLPYLSSGGVYALDMQTAAGSIHDIHLEYVAPTIGTITQMEFVDLSITASNVPYTGAMVVAHVENVNVVYAGGTKTPERGIRVNLNALASAGAQVMVNILNNSILHKDGWGSTAVTAGVHLDVPATFHADAYVIARLSDNNIDTGQFLRALPAAPGGTAAHGGAGDLSDHLELHITGNRIPTSSATSIIIWSSNQCFTSKVRISDNAIGSWGNRWNAPFDYAKILPGCDFATGAAPTPARVNGPSSEANAHVAFRGPRKTVDPGGGRVYYSETGAGVTWYSRDYTV